MLSVLMLLLLLLRVVDLGVHKGDAEGASVGADRVPTEVGGPFWRVPPGRVVHFHP